MNEECMLTVLADVLLAYSMICLHHSITV